MSKYHYNPDTGKVGICKAGMSNKIGTGASKGCPFNGGISQTRHFDTPEEAQKGYEKEMENFTTKLLKKGMTKEDAHYIKEELKDGNMHSNNSRGSYDNASKRAKKFK